MDMTDVINTVVPDPSNHVATLRLYDIFIPLLGFFIITLNLLVVISSGLLLKRRQQPRTTYLFLGNVGLSDLLTGIAVLFGQFFPKSMRSDFSCAFQMGMIVSSTTVSVLSVLLVAIDRFLFILYGMQYQQYIFPNRARILILSSWIIGIVLGFLPTMVPILRGTMTGRQCWFILMHPEYILSATIIGVASVLIVIFLYTLILCKALKKVRELKKATGSDVTETANNLRYFAGSTANLSRLQEQDTAIPERRQSKKRCLCWESNSSSETNPIATTVQSSRQPSKWKAIKIVLFTTGSFVLTWVPYFIAATMAAYCDHENNPNFCEGLIVAVASPLAILGFSNSLLNPIIYAWWHNGFRTNSIRILSNRLEQMTCCRWCCRKSDDNIASPRTTNLTSTTNLSYLSPLASLSTSSMTPSYDNIIITAIDGNDYPVRNCTD